MGGESTKEMKTEQESLSDFWRKRQSNNLPEELANVLNGARGYIGFFGSDFTADWGRSSSVEPEHKRVELDFSPLADKFPPFDGKDIDLVMGTAIHESGHIKWSYPPEEVSDYYTKRHLGYRYSKRDRSYYTSYHLAREQRTEISELRTVANIIEDFYVENKISETYPTLGAYLRDARKLDAEKIQLPHNLLYDLTTDNPSFDSVLTMWGAIALIDKTIPESASETSKKLLNKLINHTIDSAKAKPQKRLQIAYTIWGELKALDRANRKEQERLKQQAKHQQEQSEQQKEQSGGGASPVKSKNEDKSQGENNEQEKEKEQEPEKNKDESEPSGEKASTEEFKAKEETPESDDRDTEPENGQDSEDKSREKPESGSGDGLEPQAVAEDRLEQDLDEPYQNHEQLRDCYSINLDEKESMPEYLKDSVDFYLERRPENITHQVDQIIGGAGGKEIVMELAGSNPSKANHLFRDTRRVAQEVSKLFMQDKRLRTRYRRGLLEGAVDPRRLAKAGASDYKLFERREVLSMPSLAVGVLVDASGSMAFGMNRMDSAMKFAMALKTALSIIEGVDLMIMAYNTDIPSLQHYRGYGHERHTTLHRIYDRKTGEFRPDVTPAGGTPSGYAIAGMVSQIGRYLKGKDKLIIHITDGAPNSYEDVSRAVDYCKEHGIEVMTLTLHRFDGDVIEAYRGLAEHLNSMDKLPEAIASLLKKRLQKRMMRIK